MTSIPEDIILLLLTARERSLTEQESIFLKEWLAKNPEAENEFSDLFENSKLALILSDIDVKRSWKILDETISHSAEWQSRKTFRVRRLVAAVFVPLLFMAAVLYWINGSENSLRLVEGNSTIYPGAPRAELIFAGGKKIILEDQKPKSIIDQQGRLIGIDTSNTLVYYGDVLMETERNILRIPLGGEYRLILADGTKVWLNSGSELIYPTRFTGKFRQVELKGEAFFEVTKDSLHPFELKTPFSKIHVLGTSFNVSGYPEDEHERTTLVEGKVEVIVANRVYQLLPGKQLEVNTGNYAVSIKEVDTEIYSSWKDGIFRFSDMSLEELVVKLQRWYNAEFFFIQDECRQVHFTGAIRKYADFREFMSLIETTTDLRFIIKGNTVVIQKK